MLASTTTDKGKRAANIAEWERHKQYIEDLYITENLSLEDVKNAMAEKHSFQRSKAQYEGALKKWGFRKNMSKDGWKHTLHRVEKRTSQNKQSMVKVGGRIRTEKSIAKARHRYSYQTFAERLEACHGTPPDTSEAVVVTPPATASSPGFSSDLPWFQFCSLFASIVQSHPTRTSVAWMVQFEPESTRSSVSLEPAVSAMNGLVLLMKDNHNECHAEIRQISSFLPYGPDGNGQVLRLDTNAPYVDLLTALYTLSNNLPINSREQLDRRLLEICRSKEGLEFLRGLLASRNRTIMAAAEALLVFAVSTNDGMLIKVLLSAGTGLEVMFAQRPEFGWSTGLEIAVGKGYKNFVSLLIEAGAGVDPLELTVVALEGCFDIDIVKLLLEYPVPDGEILQWNDFLETLLELDLKMWSIELVNLLLGYLGRSKTNCEVVEGLLLLSVKSGKQEVVQYLLSLEVDLNLAILREKTSLELAVSMDDVSMVKLLVAYGAHPNRRQHSYTQLPTALQIAARNGNLYLVRYLLKHGAHVNAAPFKTNAEPCGTLGPAENRNKVEMTTLQAGVQGGNLAVVEILLKAGASLAESHFGDILQTALEIACNGYADDMIHLLLSRGAKVDAETTNLLIWNTPLTRALSRKRKHIIELLLERGADINIPSKDSRYPSPLQVCVAGGEIDMVERFLDLGAHPYDSGALWTATDTGNHQIIRLLLQHNEKVFGFTPKYLETKPNDYGRAAITTAIKNRDHESTRLLVEAGVDITHSPQSTYLGCLNDWDYLVKYSPQDSALAAAISVMDVHLVRMLLDAGADVKVCPCGDRKYAGCVFKDLDLTSPNIEEVVELLSSNGAPMHRCKSILRPLRLAIEQNFPEMVRFLLMKATDIDLLPDEDQGKTSLQLAAEKGLDEIVQILIEFNVDTNASPAEYRGATAIQFAAIQGNFKILQLLLAAGANLFAHRGDWNGRTALEGAAEHGRLDMAQFILMKSTEMKGTYFEHQLCRAIKYARRSGYMVLAELIRSHQVERYGSSECRGHESVFVLGKVSEYDLEEMRQLQAAFPGRCFDSELYEEEVDPAFLISSSVISDTLTEMSDDSDDFESAYQDSNSIAAPSALANNQESFIPNQAIIDVVSATEMEGVDFHNAWHPEEPHLEQGYQYVYDEMLMIPPFDIDQIVPEVTSSGFIVEEHL